MRKNKIIIAVTGASGSIYASLLTESLLRLPAVEEIALIVSSTGKEVAAYEKIELNFSDPRVRLCRNGDMFDKVASGSSLYDAMVIIPCSMGTLGRVANGVSSDLIGRAADVMLKERRKMIVVPRESPFSAIHLDNMRKINDAGAIVIPASPSFYSHPKGITELCMTVVERVLAHLDVPYPRYVWRDEQETF